MTYSTEQAEDAESNAYAKAHFYTRDNMKLALQEKIARRQQRKLHHMANTVTRKLIDADIARGVPPHQISRAAAKGYYDDALTLVTDIANAGETRRINIPSVATARLKHYYDGDADKP